MVVLRTKVSSAIDNNFLLLSICMRVFLSEEGIIDIRGGHFCKSVHKLRTPISFCRFANLISSCKYLRICSKKLKFATNPQSNSLKTPFQLKKKLRYLTICFLHCDIACSSHCYITSKPVYKCLAATFCSLFAT